MGHTFLKISAAVMFLTVASAAAASETTVAQFPQLEVVGLFRNTAVIRINGEQHLIKVGQTTPEGIKLIAANQSVATLSFAGERRQLRLSRRVAGSYQKAQTKMVTISADSTGQYRVRGSFNGHFLDCLVDTGASLIAMSSAQADKLGIDYLAGQKGLVETANGRVTSYFISLDEVKIGGITRHNVKTAVVRGYYPTQVLLGMSFLSGLKMQESNGVMSLLQSY